MENLRPSPNSEHISDPNRPLDPSDPDAFINAERLRGEQPESHIPTVEVPNPDGSIDYQRGNEKVGHFRPEAFRGSDESDSSPETPAEKPDELGQFFDPKKFRS